MGGAGPKVKYSRWLITVQPNRKPGTFPGGEPAMRARLQLCARILQKDKVQPYVYLLKKEHSFERNVMEVDVDSAIEKGPRGFLHAHMYLSIKHTTALRLSYPVLRSAFSKILGVPKAHFDAKLVKGGETLDQVRSYIHKQKKPQPAPTAADLAAE